MANPLPHAPAWQPIETAPKDGTRILGWPICSWLENWVEPIHWSADGWLTDDDMWIADDEQPTHWHVLPSPPKESR